MKPDTNRVIELKVCCVVRKEDQILLIKEWSDAKKGYFWNVIKGTFEGENDRDLITCAKREILEEAKVNALPTGFIGIVNKNGFSTRLYFGFLCEMFEANNNTKKKSNKNIAGEDIKEIKWFDLSEIRNMREDQFVNDVGYYFIQKWLKKKIYPIDILKEFNLNS